MLQQFRVNRDDAIFVQADDLQGTVAPLFERMGVPPEDAALAADVLVLADLRGVDTHGVSNMLRSYVAGYQSGDINPRPDWKVLRQRPATANIDSDRGLGTIITPKAMEMAIGKATEVGVGMVTIGNSRHLGMASYHAMLALEHDMIGVCMTSTSPSMPPPAPWPGISWESPAGWEVSWSPAGWPTRKAIPSWKRWTHQESTKQ